MSKRPKLIDGIYNYCDRWCERCSFTARCRTFAMEKKLRRRMRRREKGPAAASSWETYDAVAEKMQPWLDAQRDEVVAKVESRQNRVENEPLARRGEDYARAAGEWIERHAVPEGNAEAADAVHVIRWYQLFIVVKLMRALSADDEEDAEEQAGEDAVNPEVREIIDQAGRDDNNGSAKVALIAMDRSIAAWAVLGRAGLPDTEDLIRRLDALRRVAEQVFPHARDFIRPGLDWPD